MSGFGFSMVFVIFEDSVDYYWARSRVLENLSGIKGRLPANVTPSLLERIVVEQGTITTNNGWAVGGIAGYMHGGTLYRSYAKGTVNGSPGHAAGGPSAPAR